MDSTTQPPIVFTAETITEAQVRAFHEAVGSTETKEIPSTFATRYRKAEFEWLDKVDAELKGLLHTDQTFEILVPLKIGDTPEVSTSVLEAKNRRSMRFFTLLTEVRCQGVLKVRSTTRFVVREGA